MKHVGKRILMALGGIVMVAWSIYFIPHCDGDIGYILFTVPLGLAAIFKQDCFDLD